MTTTLNKFFLSPQGLFLSCLLALVAVLPMNAFSQESLPPLDNSLFGPESTDKAPPKMDQPSPFTEEKIFGNEANNLPNDAPPAVVPSLPSNASSGSLNNLFSHQWVHTTSDGRLKGSVVTLVGQDTLSVSGVNVSLTRNGKVVATVQSNVDGDFTFENVSPGYYSIIAAADNSFAAYGLAVMSEDNGSHLPGFVELRVIRPSSEDIRRILNVDTVPVRELSSDDNGVRDPIAAKRVFAKSHRVMSTKEGKIVGRLSRLGMDPQLVDMSQMKAMLLKDGRVISRSDVDIDGAFEFESVEAGCYGFAAAGNKGVAAVAFCVVSAESYTQQLSTNGKRFVATFQDAPAAKELNVELANTDDVMSVKETTTEKKSELEDEEVAAEELAPVQPMMPYGGSNMFGAGQIIPASGGGGAGINLGDIAGLVGAGAVAWVIADSLNDDDENNMVVSPIVPVAPVAQ